jgi:hypothetical protein
MGLNGDWIPLYESREGGLSFSAFETSLVGYRGPTVVLIYTTDGDVFGYYSQMPWIPSKQWYAEEDKNAFLFTLQPRWQVFELQDNEQKKYHQFLRRPPSTVWTKTNNGELYGWAVGGVAADSPRLHITGSLERCMAGSYDSTFEQGPLLANDELFFAVDELQVFAVGVSQQEFVKGSKVGQDVLSMRESARHRAAQVDKKQFVDDLTSGVHMSRMFAHREQMR